MRHTFSRPQLYVTTPPPITVRVDYTTELVPTGKYHPIPGLDGVEPNATIHLANVELFDKYELGEHTYGRHKYKIIYATTTDGKRFLLHDDSKHIHNARQYGSGDDPAFWGVK